MTGKIKEISSDEFDKFIRDDKTVIDFWAPWCGPCKIIGPIFEEAAIDLKDKAKFGKVNVDESSDLAQRFGIMSIPTIMFFRDGQPVDKVVGVLLKEELIKRVKEIR